MAPRAGCGGSCPRAAWSTAAAVAVIASRSRTAAEGGRTRDTAQTMNPPTTPPAVAPAAIRPTTFRAV